MNCIFTCKYCKKLKEIEFKGFSIIDSENKQGQNDALKKIIENETCSNCYKELIKQKKEELERIQKKTNDIDNIIKLIDKHLEDTIFSSQLESNIEDFQVENNKSMETFISLKKTQKELEEEIENQLIELKKLKTSEEKIWSNFERLENEMTLLSKNLNCEKVNLSINENIQINLLKTNIFKLLFDLEVTENYGTINGIKMYYSDNNFKFSEIYCGWGHIIFLTTILNYRANKILNMNDEHNFKIYYALDHSYIIDFNDKTRGQYLFYSEVPTENNKKKIEKLNQSMKIYLRILKVLIKKYQRFDLSIQNLNTDFEIGENSINKFSILCDLSEKTDKNWNLCIRNIIIILQILIKSILNWENKQLTLLLEKTKLFQINK